MIVMGEMKKLWAIFHERDWPQNAESIERYLREQKQKQEPKDLIHGILTKIKEEESVQKEEDHD